MAVSLPALHIVVHVTLLLISGGLGYRALLWPAEDTLKKKHLLCRYCEGWQRILTGKELTAESAEKKD